MLQLGVLDLRRHGRTPAPAGLVVVAHVPRRLLEVGGEATPLQRLRERLRRLLAREVDAAELGDGVVTELHEHPVVQLLGPLDADARHLAAFVEVLGELVEEEPAERLRRARIASEQGSLHDLRQVHEREHRTVEVREEPGEDRALILGEPFGREPEAHGDGEGDGDGDGEDVRLWCSTIRVSGGTADPDGVSCCATLMGLGHSGRGSTGSPNSTRRPSPSSSAFALA